MKKTRGKVLVGLLVLLLILSNAYWLVQSQKADLEVWVGLEKTGEDETAAVDFTKSKPLTDKETVHTVLLALIHADSVEEPAQAESQTVAALWISDPDAGVTYPFTVWLDDASVFVETGKENARRWKEVQNPSDAERLREIIQSQIHPVQK